MEKSILGILRHENELVERINSQEKYIDMCGNEIRQMELYYMEHDIEVTHEKEIRRYTDKIERLTESVSKLKCELNIVRDELASYLSKLGARNVD